MTACTSTKNPPEVQEEKVPPKVLPIEPTKEESTSATLLNKEQIELKNSLELYLGQLKSLNTENIVAMTYPKLFTATSEYLYRGSLYTMINSSNLNITSFNTDISKIGKVQSFSNGSFSNIAYTSIIKIQFINPELYTTELSLNTLHSILAKKYGQKNIYVDKEKRSIHITKYEKMLAIKERGIDWKFLGDNPAYRELYPHFLPNDILDRI
jgi:hypothetical protein